LHCEDADLAGLQVICDLLGQGNQGARSEILQNPSSIGSANSFYFVDQAGRDFSCRLISNNCNFLAGLNAQADIDRIAGAGNKFRIECKRADLLVGLADRNVHHPAFLAGAWASVPARPTSVSSIM